jgi:hypothetical protein
MKTSFLTGTSKSIILRGLKIVKNLVNILDIIKGLTGFFSLN